MDRDSTESVEPRERSIVRPLLITAVVALLAGLLLGRFMLPTGDDIEIIEGELGVVSDDLDAVGLQGSGESYDLTHATGTECLDGLEPGTRIFLGMAEVTTGDEEIPSEAFLGTPEAHVVLWVECATSPQAPTEGENS